MVFKGVLMERLKEMNLFQGLEFVRREIKLTCSGKRFFIHPYC